MINNVILIYSYPIVQLSGNIVGIFILFIIMKRRITAYKVQLQLKDDICQIFEKSHDIFYYYKLKPYSHYIYISPSLDEFLGEGTIDLLMNNFINCFDIVHLEDVSTMEKKLKGRWDYSKPIVQRFKAKNDTYITFEEYTSPIYENGEFIGIQGVLRNIDEKVKLEQILQYQATHDSLTDLYNRMYFEEQMQKLNQQDHNQPVTIVLCDVDGLKQVNDQLGHLEGDCLIQKTAYVLKQYFNEHGIVARIGGDEFAVIMIDYDEVEATMICEGFKGMLSRYNNKHNDALSVSFGYAYSDHSVGQMETLFVLADKRMYKQKQAKYEVMYE